MVVLGDLIAKEELDIFHRIMDCQENIKDIYELESRNLTGLGGSMDSEHTWRNWNRYFTSIDEAKNFAERDYKSKAGDFKDIVIEWGLETEFIDKTIILTSQDLRWVMYYIRKIVIS